MAKNLIPEIAKMLGVEIGEEFKIKDGTEVMQGTYCIDERGYLFEITQGRKQVSRIISVLDVYGGFFEIVKLPWKPQLKEKYWIITKDVDCDHNIHLVILEDYWYGCFDEKVFLKAGLIFHTREEAEAALPEVAKELGVEYEL